MGNALHMPHANFEDVQTLLKQSDANYILSTLPDNCQDCLILNTLVCGREEATINAMLQSNRNVRIIIYGKNCSDESCIKKFKQLQSLGFKNVYVYPGGLFEWLLLQDIYGFDDFPTTKKELDVLRFKPLSKLNVFLLQN